MSQVSLTYTTFAEPSNFNFRPGFSGSASWKVSGDTLDQVTRSRPKPHANPTTAASPPSHGINKSKVSRKIKAFCRLEKSKRFLAFFTVTFPNGMPDHLCYRSLNIVLTRLRKSISNFNYIWVAERQKNGTIHFHLLTNNYINVRIFNHFAKMAISTQVTTLMEKKVRFIRKNYNGVDVQRVYNPNKVGSYIAKYVTKNDIHCSNAVWNCSRSVSALMTSYRTDIDVDWALKYFAKKLYSKTFELAGTSQEGKITIYGFVHDPPRSLLLPLDELNEYIMLQS